MTFKQFANDQTLVDTVAALRYQYMSFEEGICTRRTRQRKENNTCTATDTTTSPTSPTVLEDDKEDDVDMEDTKKTTLESLFKKMINSFSEAFFTGRFADRMLKEFLLIVDQVPIGYFMVRISNAVRRGCTPQFCTCGGKQLDLVQISVVPYYQRKKVASFIATMILQLALKNKRSFYIESCVSDEGIQFGKFLLKKFRGLEVDNGQSLLYTCDNDLQTVTEKVEKVSEYQWTSDDMSLLRFQFGLNDKLFRQLKLEHDVSVFDCMEFF